MGPSVLALLIPIVAIVCVTIIKVTGRRSGGGGMLPEVAGRLEALEGEVTALRQELTETQERLDFAERLLADRSGGRPLNPGA